MVSVEPRASVPVDPGYLFAGQRQSGERGPQSAHLDPAAVQVVVQGPVVSRQAGHGQRLNDS
jgi:hypothetical protein